MRSSSAATSFSTYIKDLKKDDEELYREGVIAYYVEKDLERAIICYQRSGYPSHAATVADKLTNRLMESLYIACGKHTPKIKRLYRLMRSAYKSSNQEDKVIAINHLMGKRCGNQHLISRRRGTQHAENKTEQLTNSARVLEEQAETLMQNKQSMVAKFVAKWSAQRLLRKASELYLTAGKHERAAELLISICDLKRASAIYERNRCFEDAAKLQEQMGNTQRAENLFERAFLEYELFAKAFGKSGTGIIMFGGIGTYRLASQRLASERGWGEYRIAQVLARNSFLE